MAPASHQAARRLGVQLVCALLIAACGSATSTSPPASQAPPAVSAPGSATAATALPSLPPTSSPIAASDAPIPDPIECAMGEDIEPGTYRSPYVWRMVVTFVAPAGWRLCREDVPGGGVVALVRGEGNEIGHAREWLALFAIPVGEDVPRLLEDLRATLLIEPGPATDVELGGEPGVAFDATALANPDQPGGHEIAPGAISFPAINRIFAPHQWRSETAEARFRFLVVSHGDQGLVAYLEAPAASFDALVADSAVILDSIRFAE